MTGFSRGTMVTLLLLCLYIGGTTCADNKCYKNEAIGDQEGNVYYCTDTNKPDCCEENSEFTCCETQASVTWKSQLQLWGTVAAVALLIGFVFYFCKNDTMCCNGGDDSTLTLLQKLGIRKAPVEPAMTDISKAGQPGMESAVRYDKLPPLPPMEETSFGYGGSNRAGYRGRANAGYDDDDDDDYRY